MEFTVTPGQEINNAEVSYQGHFTTRYGTAYRFSLNDEVLVCFEYIDWKSKNVPNVNDILIISFLVKKTDVYQGKKSVTITKVQVHSNKQEDAKRDTMQDVLDIIHKVEKVHGVSITTMGNEFNVVSMITNPNPSSWLELKAKILKKYPV